MIIKLILYVFIMVITIKCFESLDLYMLFNGKKEKELKMLILLISVAISYAVVNFIIDFTPFAT